MERRLARARKVFDDPGTKEAGLTFREAFDRMATGATVRRKGWKDVVVGIRIPEPGELAKPFILMTTQFPRKDGSVETVKKPWTPYIDDFHTRDWAVV